MHYEFLASPFDAKAEGLGANAMRRVYQEIARFSRAFGGFSKALEKPIHFQPENSLEDFTIRRTLFRPLPSPPSTLSPPFPFYFYNRVTYLSSYGVCFFNPVWKFFPPLFCRFFIFSFFFLFPFSLDSR